MKEQLQSKLVEILTSAQAVGGDAYEYVKSQAPLLVEEIIKWRLVGLWADVIFSLMSVVAILAGLYGVHRFAKVFENNENDLFHRSVHPIRICFVFSLFIFMPLSTLKESVTDIFKCHYAPRIFFIQSCKELVK